jgi:hypothetical protein
MGNWYILWTFGIPILWTFGIFYGHLVYLMDIWNILWLFGVIFPFWYVVPRQKSGNPARKYGLLVKTVSQL